MVRKLMVSFRPKDHVELACALAGVLDDMPGGAGEWVQMQAGAAHMVGRAKRRTRGVSALLETLDGKKGVLARFMGRFEYPCSAGLPYGQVYLDLAALGREREDSVAWVADAFGRLVADLEHVAGVDLEVDARAGGKRVPIGDLASLFREWVSTNGAAASRRLPGNGADDRQDARAGNRPGTRPGRKRQMRALSESAASFIDDAGISWPASGEDLDAAFKRCAFVHHPDRNQGDDTATARFTTLKQGYEELKQLSEIRHGDETCHAGPDGPERQDHDGCEGGG